jgi:hypothetical protein
MAAFVREYCQGKQYDSCANSPCPFSSPNGCQHPMHPKHNRLVYPRHYTEREITFDERPSGVLITYADGSTKLLLNARIDQHLVEKILKEASRPLDMVPELRRAHA